MQMWTFQSKEVFDKLKCDGVHKARLFKIFKDAVGKSDEKILREVLKISSYEWMAQKMRDNGIPLEDGHYPVWLWKTLSHELLDFYQGQDLVLMKLNIPEELVLLSSFSGFEYVIQYLYLNTEEKTDYFMRKCEKQDDNFFDNKPLKNEKLHNELVKSWDNALNLDFCEKVLEDTALKVQGAIGELRKEWIINAFDLDGNKELEIL